MIIDLVFLVLIILAVIKGYSRGLIIALFSVIALLVGLAAAMKLSAAVASYLKGTIHVSAKWLPVLAFIIVFVIAVILVRIGARAIEKAIEWALMGWINRLGGILLYICLYLVIYSVVLFYVTKLHLLSAQAIADSRTYAFIEPWGPKTIEGIGTVLPFFKNMFHELEDFFSGISGKISLR